ncbi:MAG: hypothetical protein ACNA8W_24950 [Bradymonadaceae bacterium]
MKNSGMLFAIFFALALVLSFGCSTVKTTGDDDVRSGQHALTAEGCQDQCKEDFHSCKESPDQGGGPGASACAHEKNACESSCGN